MGALALGGGAGALGRRALSLSRALGGAGLAPSGEGAPGAVTTGLGGRNSPQGLIVRGLAPHNLETPRALLATLDTPLEHFFVRTHAHPPHLVPERHTLTIDGLVERPLTLSIEDLRGRADASGVRRRAVLQCAGNGRAYFRPRVPGVPWEAGAMGQAHWSGARLADVLREAAPRSGARFLHLRAADTMSLAETPPYVRTIPLERALEDDALLALGMNGAPLPWLHGGPLRLVLPGWTGNHWVKWLSRATVSDTEETAFFAKAAYRMPRAPIAPGAPSGPTDPVTENGVKAVIARPLSGEAVLLERRTLTVTGVAFSGRTHVVAVEVSVDDGRTWRAASLEGDDTEGAWKVFRAEMPIERPGLVSVAARARDARGAVQPEAALWNPSGYLWNAVDRVTVEAVL